MDKKKVHQMLRRILRDQNSCGLTTLQNIIPKYDHQ